MWYVLIFSLIAAFADVIGGALPIVKTLTSKKMMVITGMGAGFLLGATILDRLPEAMEELPSLAPVCIITGYLFLLVIDLFSHVDLHTTQTEEKTAKVMNTKSAIISFIGFMFHTFMDGVIIAGAFSLSNSTGILIFLAIALHKIPEGFSMAAISLASGSSRKRALLSASALAVSTLAGTLFTLQIGGINAFFVKGLMAFATGTFLFISTTDMVPVIRGRHRGPIICVIIGVAIFYFSLLLIKHVGLD